MRKEMLELGKAVDLGLDKIRVMGCVLEDLNPKISDRTEHFRRTSIARFSHGVFLGCTVRAV
jgi:hypothetical protein